RRNPRATETRGREKKTSPQKTTKRRTNAENGGPTNTRGWVHTPKTPNPATPMARRPQVRPTRLTRTWLTSPPQQFAQPATKNGSEDSRRSFSLNPRAFTRYVWNHDRKK